MPASSEPPEGGSHPYLRAATAGLRHHARTRPPDPADRAQLDLLHAHLTALHQLLDDLTTVTRQPHPAAGRQLAAAHTHLWQATAAVHTAFHRLPTAEPDNEGCAPRRLDGPPFVTICHRHLTTVHAVRRRTTPSDLASPPHSHTTG